MVCCLVKHKENFTFTWHLLGDTKENHEKYTARDSKLVPSKCKCKQLT